MKLRSALITVGIVFATFFVMAFACNDSDTQDTSPTTELRPPTVAEVKASMEKQLTEAHGRDYDKVEFQWVGAIDIGSLEKRGDPTRLCYPVKLNVDLIFYYKGELYGKPFRRGTNRKEFSEIFCFFKDGFGEWDSLMYSR